MQRRISNTQTFHLKKIKNLVCLFPTNIRNFSQKIQTFLKKCGKRGGKQTNYKIVLENRQNENFCLTYFPTLNRDPIEKKFYRFEDPHCNRGHHRFDMQDVTKCPPPFKSKLGISIRIRIRCNKLHLFVLLFLFFPDTLIRFECGRGGTLNAPKIFESLF